MNYFGIVKDPKYGKIYAYETDGYGNHVFMDDANVPSLLSIPYLGYVNIDDEIYQNTRQFILSKENPYYYEGEVVLKELAHLIHGRIDIWPIALSM